MIKIYKYLIALVLVMGVWIGINAQQTLTLEKALLLAESGSPSIKKAHLSLEQSQQSLIAQKAALKARFSLSLNPLSYNNTLNFDDRYSSWYNYEKLSSYGTLTVSQPILPTNTTISVINSFGWQQTSSNYSGVTSTDKSFVNDFYVALKQPLFTYNSQKMSLKELELSVENAEIEYSLSRLLLEKTVTTLFFDVYIAQLYLDIANEELKNTQKTRDIIADKVQNGLAAEVELYQADLNLSTAKSTISYREVSLEDAKADFKKYVGIDLGQDISVIATVDASDSLLIPVNKAIEYGLDLRMELRQRKIEIENEQFTLTKTKDYNDFDGSVTLSMGLTGNDPVMRNIYNMPAKSPSVEVTFSVPLFDWGERKALIKAQEAAVKSTVVDLDSEKTGIAVEIGKICRSIQNYKIQMDIEKQNQRNAELAYDINLEKYKNGDLTSMELNLYQSQLSNKKISLAEARINYKLELLNLKIATLYDFEKNQSVTVLHKK